MVLVWHRLMVVNVLISVALWTKSPERPRANLKWLRSCGKSPRSQRNHVFRECGSKLEDLDAHIVLLRAMQGGGTAIVGAGSNASGSSVGQGSESYDLFSILDRLAHGEIIPQTV